MYPQLVIFSSYNQHSCYVQSHAPASGASTPLFSRTGFSVCCVKINLFFFSFPCTLFFCGHCNTHFSTSPRSGSSAAWVSLLLWSAAWSQQPCCWGVNTPKTLLRCNWKLAELSTLFVLFLVALGPHCSILLGSLPIKIKPGEIKVIFCLFV